MDSLLAVLVGRARAMPGDPPWTSGYDKSPVDGAVMVHPGGLAGDEQADRRVHGGPDKAVCVYAAARLAAWRDETGLDLAAGAFGENFHVAALTEDSVSIGDTWRVGTAVLQVAQPRGPCWKIGRRWGRPGLSDRVRETGWTGWYLRVLEPGLVRAGDPIHILARPHPEWTIARANAVTHPRADHRDAAARAALAACPLLAPNWRARLEDRP